MYLDYYHFRKEPFNVTPDPEFFYLSSSHKEAFASIVYGIMKRKGFIAILGEVGLGKTTVLRSCLEKMDREQLKIVYIFNANVTYAGLVKLIYREMGLDESKARDLFEAVHYLQQVLIEEYKQGNNVALIIDDAQNMPTDTLEHLRMLSNLETTEDKLLQIVLIGQPELQERLDLHRLRQLKQRIAIRHEISPLSPQEGYEYIHHRLAKVQMKKETVFTQGALKEILKYSKGVPRAINILCDNALLTAFGYQKKPVTAKIVKEVIRDFEGKGRQSWLKWAIAAATVLLTMIGLYRFLPHMRHVHKSSVANQVTHSGPAADATESSTAKQTPKQTEPANQAISTQKKTPNEEPLKPPSDSNQKNVTSVVREKIPHEESPASQKTVPAPAQTSDRSSASPQADSRWVQLFHSFEPVDGEDASPAPVSPPVPASTPAPVAAGATGPQVKIVEKGDTISGLCLAIYGFSDERLTQWIKQNNPHIWNPNIIEVGSQIVFPELPREYRKLTASKNAP